MMALFPLPLLLLAVIFQYSDLDVWWVSHFYDFQNQMWPYKHHWFFEGFIHSGGRWFYWVAVLICLLAFIVSNFQQDIKRYRKTLLYLLLATLAGPVLVVIGKNLTHIYTPWDLQMFGGAQPYIRLFDPVPAGAPIGHACPAGHAALGYSFFSLYFSLRYAHPSYRTFGFLTAIGLGLIFGLGQQIRGAHFPSHDLFSLATCWYAAMIIHLLLYPNRKPTNP